MTHHKFHSMTCSTFSAPLKSTFTVILLVATIAISFFTFPEEAHAGVLLRGVRNANVRSPRASNRSIRDTSAALKSTNPDLSPHTFKDNSTAVLVKAQRQYEQKLARWERKVARIEEQNRRKDEKRKALLKREADKRISARMRAERRGGPTGGSGTGSVAHNPKEWFEQKIASSGAFSMRGPKKAIPTQQVQTAPQPSAEIKGKEILGNPAPPQPAKSKPGFWTHIWHALGGS